MDNGMENMLDMYLFETNSLLDQLDEILLDAEKTSNFTADSVNEIFRIMHTIKGSSAMMEFNSLMTIAHRIEDLFYIIREKGIESVDESLRHSLFDLMFHSTDCLRAEVEKVENNEPLSDNIDNFIDDINTFLNKIKINKDADSNTNNVSIPEEKDIKNKNEAKKISPGENNKFSVIPGDDSPYFLKLFFDEGCGMENLRAFMITSTIKEACQNFKFYPQDIETNKETSQFILENGFVLSFKNKLDLDKAINIVKNSGNIQTYEILEDPDKIEDEAEEKKEDEIEIISTISDGNIPAPKEVSKPLKVTSAKPTPAPAPAQATANKQSLISVNLTKLDKLMAIVGEIVITESMVTSSPEIQGIKLDNFTKSARQLRKLTDELQDISMSIRMVPVSGVFHKMNRIVRDMGQKLGKDVRLTIVGEDTEVDKTIVDCIGDPIMHIVRNSMDHGIEATEDERINSGKDTQGEIILSAQHTGSEVIISIKDDGTGVDTSKVLAKAKANGILVKPETEYSKKEILALLLVPGFSTNENVTEFSGRGVGMDVVKKNVEKVGGTVTITSDYGEGTCTALKIPLTMAIVDGMEIAVGKSIFTIPITDIRQSFKVSADEVIHDADRGEIIKRMDEFYPIIRIHELYNIQTDVTNIEDGILVWVETSDKSYCLFVDELLGEQQVVVKPLPAYLNSYNVKNSGIAGCTILGDGNISIILDINNVYTTHNLY